MRPWIIQIILRQSDACDTQTKTNITKSMASVESNAKICVERVGDHLGALYWFDVNSIWFWRRYTRKNDFYIFVPMTLTFTPMAGIVSLWSSCPICHISYKNAHLLLYIITFICQSEVTCGPIKCHKMRLRPGPSPGPLWGAYGAPQGPDLVGWGKGHPPLPRLYPSRCLRRLDLRAFRFCSDKFILKWTLNNL